MGCCSTNSTNGDFCCWPTDRWACRICRGKGVCAQRAALYVAPRAKTPIACALSDAGYRAYRAHIVPARHWDSDPTARGHAGSPWPCSRNPAWARRPGGGRRRRNFVCARLKFGHRLEQKGSNADAKGVKRSCKSAGVKQRRRRGARRRGARRRARGRAMRFAGALCGLKL
jgi:hypothetical protein